MDTQATTHAHEHTHVHAHNHAAVMEAGGFTVVSRRRGGRAYHVRPKPASSNAAFRYTNAERTFEDDTETSLAILSERMDAAKEELRTSNFWQWLRRLLEPTSTTTVVCLGVGNFSSNASARYQMSLALMIEELLRPTQKTTATTGSTRLIVFDPVLTSLERSFIRALGCTVPTVNDEGRIATTERTLFFMPHCAKQLYSNVLDANFAADALERVVILGNSFGSYLQVRRCDGCPPNVCP